MALRTSVPLLDLTGMLLIATPTMRDPRFARSVVLICAYSDEGAMGVIVNKPLPDLSLSDLLKHLELEPSEPADAATDRGPELSAQVHFGGPVEPGRGFVLHSPDYFSEDGSLRVTDRVVLSTTLDILSEIARGQAPALCLTALGYAGWSSGQLDAEIQTGGWLMAECTEALVFNTPDGRKWEATLAQIGVDPSMLSSTPGRA